MKSFPALKKKTKSKVTTKYDGRPPQRRYKVPRLTPKSSSSSSSSMTATQANYRYAPSREREREREAMAYLVSKHLVEAEQLGPGQASTSILGAPRRLPETGHRVHRNVPPAGELSRGRRERIGEFAKCAGTKRQEPQQHGKKINGN